MRSLSSLILLLLLAISLLPQSPHGDKLTINCEECHNPSGWKVDFKTMKFSHGSTDFALLGQHKSLDCRSCHDNLVFSDAKPDCMSCHTDMHNQTVGFECQRCHTSNSWIVNNITQIHRDGRFPLVGAHVTADCQQCHPSSSNLEFQPLGIECVDCHSDDYYATTQPNHSEGGYSTNCVECHNINVFSWTGTNFNHDFFPLTEGHAVNDCNKCHENGDFAGTSPECFSCHEPDYNTTSNPNHNQADISIDCAECHTTKPGWKPAEFKQHDGQYFPIYSGKHNGEWNSCVDCHTQTDNYSDFTCIDCHDHNQNDMDDKHKEVNGYIYESVACLDCHPTGDAEEGFNHNQTNFPLTGGHLSVDCASCHTEGFSGTSTFCFDCHQQDFEGSTNPNHTELDFQNTCDECHSTAPGWTPATFDIHDDFYPLTGGHAEVKDECFSCHESDYSNTTDVCYNCHTQDFNETTNPNHVQIDLTNVCETCHTTNPGWKPAEFPVHDDYYTLEGAHASISTDCASCHNDDYTNTPNTCIGCHQADYDQTTDPPHESTGFSTDCEECHSQIAWEPSTFDHDGQYFPIYSGKHKDEWVNCNECHTTPSNYSMFSCIDCHEHNKTDEDEHHTGVNGYEYISEACYACHPTGDGDDGFNHNMTDFPLTGAHLSVTCADCHEDGYSGTSTFCFDCHTDNYNESSNPDHQAINLPNVCDDCHTTNPDWQPATFPIHNDFYELTGAHESISNECAQCHDGDYNNTTNVCFDCHTTNYNESTNPNHTDLDLPTTCEDCHTTLPDWEPALFPIHDDYYELTGAHTTVDCSSCHDGDYSSTPNICSECHMSNYNESTNPNHVNLDIPTTCEDCHTTTPDWEPALFPIHDDYYVIEGAHVNLDCSECHNGDYNQTPNTCFGCHEDDYNQTSDPPHLSAQFPIDCELCHTQVAWEPSTFDHDNQYFPIYSGSHQGEWNTCSDCHTNPSDYSVYSCTVCHDQSDMDDEHSGVSGYVYESTACFDCHPNGEGDKARIIKRNFN